MSIMLQDWLDMISFVLDSIVEIITTGLIIGRIIIILKRNGQLLQGEFMLMARASSQTQN